MECVACPQRRETEGAIRKINSFDEPFDEEDKDLLLNKTIKVVQKPGSHHESVECTTLLQICNKICNQYPDIEKSVISIPNSFVPKKDKKLKTHETDRDVLDIFEIKSKFVKDEIYQYTSTKLGTLKKIINSSENSKSISNAFINALALNSLECFRRTSKETQKKARQKLKNNIEKYLDEHEEMQFKDLENLIADCLTEFILFDDKDLQQKWSSYTLRAGQKSEQNVAQKIIQNLNERPALVLVGFRCWTFLHPLLQGLGISLRHAKDKNKDVEHDILAIVPTETSIEVIFMEVKTSVMKPWRKQNVKKINEQLVRALQQTTKDVETFFDMASTLIKDNMKKVSVRYFAVLPDLEILTEDLCKQCSNVVITKSDLCSKTNLAKKLKIQGNAPVLVLDSEILALYKMLVGIYGGMGSLVTLKTAKEGYKLERACLRSVKEQYKTDAESDAFIVLSSEQQDILSKRLHSYCIIGPYGGGKSLILELEILRMVREQSKTKDQLHVYISTGSCLHEKLLENYKEMAKELTERHLNVKLRVASIDELWYELGDSKMESLPKSRIYNILTEKLAQKHKNVSLIVDESIATHPGMFHDPTEASGHFTLMRDSTVFDWTTLVPHPRCRLIMAVQTQNIINFFSTVENKAQKATQTSCIPTMVLKRDFRHSRRIKDFLSFASQQSLFYSCVRALPLDVEQYGHEVLGSLPVWYNAPARQHYICKEYPCSKCFLPNVQGMLDNILKGILAEDLPREDINVLVNPENTCELSRIRDWLKKIHPHVELLCHVQATGLDIPIVIALHHSGRYLEMTEMWNRACSRLVIIGPDVKDTQVLSKAAKEGVLRSVKFKLKEQERNEERRWSIATMEVSIKHLPMGSHHAEPLPPKPLTRSRMVSWSLNFIKETALATENETKKTRSRRTEKLIQNRNVGKGPGKRRSYHKKDQGHLQRQRK